MLNESMTDEQKQLMDAYFDANTKTEGMIHFDRFRYAFHLGAQPMADTLYVQPVNPFVPLQKSRAHRLFFADDGLFVIDFSIVSYSHPKKAKQSPSLYAIRPSSQLTKVLLCFMDVTTEKLYRAKIVKDIILSLFVHISGIAFRKPLSMGYKELRTVNHSLIDWEKSSASLTPTFFINLMALSNSRTIYSSILAEKPAASDRSRQPSRTSRKER